jgi:hypothetical protein
MQQIGAGTTQNSLKAAWKNPDLEPFETAQRSIKTV